MNHKLFILFMLASLLFTACSAGGTPALTPEAVEPIIADSTIIAEGRLEPLRYAEIAFTASGRVSDILVTEGQPSTPPHSWNWSAHRRPSMTSVTPPAPTWLRP
jgi:hypothetical protein